MSSPLAAPALFLAGTAIACLLLVAWCCCACAARADDELGCR